MLKKWLSEVKWFRRPTFNCGYGYGTWMLQDDRTAFILQQRIKFAAREVQSEAKRSRKQKRTE